MQTATKIKTINRKYISGLETSLNILWEKALSKEGFGRYSTLGETNVTVQDEIDSLLHYKKLLSFYHSDIDSLDNRERFVIDYVAPFYTRESLQDVIVPRQSYVSRVIKNVSMLYKNPAVRTLYKGDEEHPQNRVYADLMRGAKMHVKAKEIHRMYTLCDMVLVRPVVIKNKLTYRMYTPDNCRIALDENDEVVKVMYGSELYDEYGGIKENIVVIWTDDNHYYRTHAGEERTFQYQPRGENPYGVVPFTLFAKDESNPFTGGMHDLVESVLHMNFLKMLESEDSAFAAMNIPFGKNIVGRKEENQKFSPRTPIIVDSDTEIGESDFKFVSGTPHSALLRDLQGKEEKSSMTRHGIAPFMLSESPVELSGKAMKTAMYELIEMRQDDAMVFESYERDLYEKSVKVGNYEGLDIPEAEFLIDFAEIEFGDNQIEQYEFDKQMVEDNLLSMVEFYRRYNTDMEDEDEILRAIQENRRQKSLMGLPTSRARQIRDAGTAQ